MQSVHPHLPISHEDLRAFCEKWQIVEFALFGSAARGEMREDSDYDVMVQFAPGAPWGLLEFVHMKLELEDFFGRSVDVVEKGTVINPYRKASIERDLTVVFAA